MIQFLKNPLTIWFAKFINSKILEYKNKDKFLKIGYLSYATNCDFGRNNTIYSEVRLDEVTLGDFTYIAGNTEISKTNIGKFCSIGPGCKIGIGKHPSSRFVSSHPIFYSTLNQAQITFADKNYFQEYETITIGNDVWIGANVIIVDGVNISDGVIIAAGSIVTKDIPPYAIIGGVPAKIIKYRFEKDEITQLIQFRWWDKDIEFFKKNLSDFHNIEELLNASNKK